MSAPSNDRGRRALAVTAAVLVLLAASPVVLGAYGQKLLQEILIWGLFGMSLNLLMGQTGMVSLGHSAYFGIGAYVAAFALKSSPGLLSALLLPIAAAALAALVLGYLCVRVKDVSFIMITLAFSQIFYSVTFQLQALGAEDGITGVPRAVLGPLDTNKPFVFHAYALGLVAVGVFLLWRINHSPFGHTLRGIRQNEDRMLALGYVSRQYKLLAFVIAGGLAGLAGALYTQLVGSINPDAFLWTTSGEVILMIVIGGTTSFAGPLVGAAVFLILQSFISSYTERWMLVLGVLFILFVLGAPGGIIGAFTEPEPETN